MPGSSSSGSGARKGGRRRASRHHPFDREAILATAIRLADDEGLGAVSIRRIAAELDGRPMSFYEHFENKEDLLWQMSNEVVGEVLVGDPLPAQWREGMTTISRRLYAMLVRHPWVPTVSQINPRFGANGETQAAQYAELMSPLGLESAEVWALVGTINDYVLGHSYRAVRVASSEAFDRSIEEPTIEAVPELSTLPDYLKSRDQVERFEAGLAIVLDGVERAIGG